MLSQGMDSVGSDSDRVLCPPVLSCFSLANLDRRMLRPVELRFAQRRVQRYNI